MSASKDLRESHKQPEAQAYGMTELENKYQIVVDVQGYAATDISVKAVGDQVLVVEGKRVETSPDGKSVNQSFSRRFALPGLVRLDTVTSALSKDGVLTVSAPKMNPTVPSISSTNNDTSNMNGPQTTNSTAFHNNFFDERQRMCDNGLSNMLSDLDLDTKRNFQSGFGGNAVRTAQPQHVAPMTNMSSDMTEEADHFKIMLDTTGYSPNDISVKAVGERELLIEGRTIKKTDTGSESSSCFNRRFCLPGPVKLEAITSSMSLDGKLTIRAPKIMEATPQIRESHMHGVPASGTVQQNTQNSSTVYETAAPQQNMAGGFDDFFNDDFGMNSMMTRRDPSSFMERARSEYEESLRNMRNRHWAVEPQESDFFGGFPAMPSTMAIQPSSDIIESETDYKMKLDVSSYGPKDITVKALGDKELLIEGKHTDKQGTGPAISQSFSRKFSLPGLVKLESVSSSLSPDGVLTITAPKA